MSKSYKRPVINILKAHLDEPRRFIQVLAGPRQAGKTTLARQLFESRDQPHHFASADAVAPPGAAWIEQQWETARRFAVEADSRRGAVLVLDEVQKVAGWSEHVKALWDADTASGMPLKVVLLGSSPLLLRRGLGESLAGRFEIIPVTHWSFAEMRDAFGWDLERYLFFGGYPGAAPLSDDHRRWSRYVVDSLVETTLSRDLLMMTRVDKPALLRQLFHLGCRHACEIVSYTKMLGQLQETGNTTTLAHYLDLLASAGLLCGIPRFAGRAVRQRASSPKLVPPNTALMSATSHLAPSETRADGEAWGRLVECAVGAHLLGAAAWGQIDVFYWRERNREIDFVVRSGRTVIGIEVKSGRERGALRGVEAFTAAFRPRRTILVGTGGVPLEEFLSGPLDPWLT